MKTVVFTLCVVMFCVRGFAQQDTLNPCEHPTCPSFSLGVEPFDTPCIAVGGYLSIWAYITQRRPGCWQGESFDYPVITASWEVVDVLATPQKGSGWRAHFRANSPGKGTLIFTVVAPRIRRGRRFRCEETRTITKVFNVVGVDLDVDSDYDGDIDVVDDPREVSAGGLLFLNDDDDNGNGMPDMKETWPVYGENDLEEINLWLLPPELNTGTLILEAVLGGEKIKVWETASKEKPVNLPKTWQIDDETVLPKSLYVEGVKASSGSHDVRLRLRYNHETIRTEDQIALTVVNFRMIPDYDRSGKIDNNDRNKADAGDKFYFWVNDDDDSGYEDDSGAGKMDIPGAVSGWLEFDGRRPDCSDLKVDGERDWVDFFPVFLDLKQVLDLIGTSNFKYVLKHSDGAVNAYIPRDLGPSDAAKHLRDYTYAHDHKDAPLSVITRTGYPLSFAFLNAVKSNGKGVILLEGKAVSPTGKLVLEIQQSNGAVIGSRELPLSLDGVEKMFLHKNLRGVGGGSGGEHDRTTAPNYPDSLCNGKEFVFIHGYNVNRVQARGWEAEMFKRMYWARNNARFHAITWHGDESQSWAWYWPWWGYICPNYHNNVVNAWKTAPAVKEYLADLSGNIYLAAHSLGNMVASCALMIDSEVVTKYFMLDAAIASEAFDPSQFNENMLHSNWIPYESLTDLYASEWHSIFGPSDKRSDLTWKGRFNSFAAKCINFYSSGDQVFDVQLKEIEPDAFAVMPHVNSGRFSWAFQEKRKGSMIKSGGDAYTLSKYAGWSFNNQNPPTGWTYQTDIDLDIGTPIYSLYTPTMAAGITTDELVTKPFFGIGTGEFRNNLFTTNAETANTWLTEENRWRIIAGTIPAMSLAVGRTDLSTVRSVNINSAFKPSYWPDRRGDTGTDWLHSDIRNMAYLYTFNLFDDLVRRGGLE